MTADCKTGSQPCRFILERVRQGDVHVGAVHPTLGMVYWQIVDESDVGIPDLYQLTECVEDALRLPEGWRDDRNHCNMGKAFLHELYKTEIFEVRWPEADGSDSSVAELDGSLAFLARKAGQSPDQLLAWLFAADWRDIAAPIHVTYLQNINGLLGYAPVWTANVDEALKLDANDPELHLLARFGQLMPYPRK